MTQSSNDYIIDNDEFECNCEVDRELLCRSEQKLKEVFRSITNNLIPFKSIYKLVELDLVEQHLTRVYYELFEEMHCTILEVTSCSLLAPVSDSFVEHA